MDTNVFMYAVGRSHPLQEAARSFFEQALTGAGMRLCTSAEVLQELLHAYIPVRRVATFDAALDLVRAIATEIWSVEQEDVELARLLVDGHPELGARDGLHLACCQRRNVHRIMTFDRALKAAFPVMPAHHT